MKLKQLRDYIKLNLQDISEVFEHETRVILDKVLGKSTLDVVLNPDDTVFESDISKVNQILKDRKLHRPLAYAIGEVDFLGHRIFVDERVLIPRLETEILVMSVFERAIEQNHINICEVGVGSGCNLVALRYLLDEHRLKNPSFSYRLYGTDISYVALEVAKKNLEFHGVQAELSQGDLLGGFIQSKFDIIFSNPPYIPYADKAELKSEVAQYEPEIALFAEEGGLLIYKRLITQISKNADNLVADLGRGLNVFFEIGHNQYENVRQILAEHNFDKITYIEDLHHIKRFIVGEKSV